MEISGKMVIVPQLEQGHVQTDVRGIQTAVFRELQEHGVQVLDVVYFFHNYISDFYYEMLKQVQHDTGVKICYGFCSFPSRS